MQQMKEIGCFACNHDNAPDQVKEKKRSRKSMPWVFCLAASIVYTTWGNGLHLSSCHKQRSMV